MSSNDDHATGNLLDYMYRQNYYKLIAIDLSRQENTNIPQEFNFTGKLEKDGGVAMFLLMKSSKKQF